MSTACIGNCSNPVIVYDVLIEDPWAPWNAAMDYFEYQPWVFSLLGSAMVGLSGILPLLIIPIDDGANLKNGGNNTLYCNMRLLFYIICLYFFMSFHQTKVETICRIHYQFTATLCN